MKRLMMLMLLAGFGVQSIQAQEHTLMHGLAWMAVGATSLLASCAAYIYGTKAVLSTKNFEARVVLGTVSLLAPIGLCSYLPKYTAEHNPNKISTVLFTAAGIGIGAAASLASGLAFTG